MTKILNSYLSKQYLFEQVTNGRWEKFYLYFSLFLMVVPVLAKIYLAVKVKSHHKEIYKNFDGIWFWGSLSFGFLGLFIWFSRTQFLPIFSIRFVSYLWLLLIFATAVLAVFYYLKTVPKLSASYYKTARKNRYLK